MIIVAAKNAASAAGLVLHWSREWSSWGLSCPEGSVESLWVSSNSMHNMSDTTFKNMFIDAMVERITDAVDA